MTVVETPVKEPAREAGQDFIRDIVRADLEAGLATVAKIPTPMMRDATRSQLQHQLDAMK